MGARDEARAVARLYGVRPLLEEAATVEAVTSQLGDAALVHLAAHGRVRADNPQFGCLRLTNGPLMIYDLEKLNGAPHTVVLAACDAGRPVAAVGDELLGLTVSLLAQGSTQLIAPVLPILDLETGPVMTTVHTAVAAGRLPAVALAEAQQKALAEGPEALSTAVGFVCFGAGFRKPPLRHPAILA
jgi:CHAT domain-containing protein